MQYDFKYYLSEKQADRDKYTKKESSHLLVCSLNTYDTLGWTKSNRGVRNSLQYSIVGAVNPITGVTTTISQDLH